MTSGNTAQRQIPQRDVLSRSLFKMRNQIVSIAITLIFVAAPILLFRSIIFRQGLIYYLDIGFPVDDKALLDILARASYAWDKDFGTGRPWGLISSLPNIFLLLFLRFLFGSIENAAKAFVVFTFAISGISMYYGSRRLGIGSFGSFLAGILYMLNPWILARGMHGHLPLLIGYAFIPLAFSFMVSSLAKKHLSLILKTSLFVFLAVSFDQRVIFIFIFLLGTYLLVNFAARVLSIVRTKRLGILQPFVFIRNYFWIPVAIVCISIVFSSFQILPTRFILSNLNPYYPTIEELNYTSSLTDLPSSFRLSGYWWHFVDQLVQKISFPWLYEVWYLLGIAFFTLLFSLVFLKRGRFTFYLVFVALVGIFLSTGTNSPLGGLYWFLFDNVPYFAVFRSPYHFQSLVSLPYSLLLGSLTDLCLVRVREMNRRPQKQLKHISRLPLRGLKISLSSFRWLAFLAITVILLLTQIGPVFFESDLTSIGSSPNSHMQIITPPSEYATLLDFLRLQRNDSRFALFPPGQGVIYPWSSSLIYEPLSVYPPKPCLSPLALVENSLQNRMTWWVYHMFYQNRTVYAPDLFGSLGVEWFVARTDALVVFPGDLIAGSSEYQRDTKMMQLINQQEGLKQIFQQGPYYIYENEHVLPSVSVSNSIILAAGDRRLLSSLSYSGIPFAWLKDHPIVFIDNLDAQTLRQLLPLSDYVIFQGNRFVDLSFKFIDEGFLLNPALYLSNTQDLDRYWVSDVLLLPAYAGDLDSEIKSFVFTSGKKEPELTLPFSTGLEGEYELWVNAFEGAEMGELKLRIDDLNEFSANFSMSQYHHPGGRGFTWEMVGRLDLKDGPHIITLGSKGNNAVSRIALVPSDALVAAQFEATQLLHSYNLTPIYVIEGEHMSTSGQTWVTSGKSPQASNGEALVGSISTEKGFVQMGSTNLFISKQGLYVIRVRLAGPSDDVIPEIAVNGESVSAGFWRQKLKDRLTHAYLAPIFLKEGHNSIEFRYREYMMPILDQILIYPYVYNTARHDWWTYDFSNVTSWQLEAAELDFKKVPEYGFSSNGTLHMWMDASPGFADPQWLGVKYSKQLKISTYINPYFEAQLSTSPHAVAQFFFLDESEKLVGVVVARSKYYKTFAWNVYELLGNVNISSVSIHLSYDPFFDSPSGVGVESIHTFIDSISFTNETIEPSFLIDHNRAPLDFISFVRESPTSIKAEVAANTSFLLVFLESYSPSWRVSFDGKEIKPIAAWSYANAFLVDIASSGSQKLIVQIEYTSQRWFYAGVMITLASLTASTCYLIWDRRRTARSVRKLSKIAP